MARGACGRGTVAVGRLLMESTQRRCRVLHRIRQTMERLPSPSRTFGSAAPGAAGPAPAGDTAQIPQGLRAESAGLLKTPAPATRVQSSLWERIKGCWPRGVGLHARFSAMMTRLRGSDPAQPGAFQRMRDRLVRSSATARVSPTPTPAPPGKPKKTVSFSAEVSQLDVDGTQDRASLRPEAPELDPSSPEAKAAREGQLLAARLKQFKALDFSPGESLRSQRRGMQIATPLRSPALARGPASPLSEGAPSAPSGATPPDSTEPLRSPPPR